MPPTDRFADAPASLSSPLVGGLAVTPHDSTDMTRTSRCLWIGGGGDIALVMFNGEVVTLKNVPSGTLIPARCTRVNSTNTTCTFIVALD